MADQFYHGDLVDQRRSSARLTQLLQHVLEGENLHACLLALAETFSDLSAAIFQQTAISCSL